MQFIEAQRDMREAYMLGIPGMATSALVWFMAGVVALHFSNQAAVLALFGGGALIFPISVLICKALGRSGKHGKGNPLGASALEGTGWFILCLPLAYGVFLANPRWFFPAMLLVIGGRYLSFKTLYGLRLYWACGATLALAAYALAAANAAPSTGAFSGAAIEFGFALAMAMLRTRDNAV